ncbi:MAG: alanine racemase [Bacillota bacterium]
MFDLGSRWVEVDTDAIMHNLREIKGLLAPGVRLMAVVKADAYGLGAVEISKILDGVVDMLGVTNLEEGIELRQQGVAGKIVLFAPLLPEQMETAIRHGLIPSLSCVNGLEALALAAHKAGVRAEAHLKVETGMGRTGIFPEKIIEFTQRLRELPRVSLAGVYTHLATASAGDQKFALEQFARYQRILAVLEREGYTGFLRHVCNSAATINLPEMHLDMVRVGTLLYGQYPSPGVARRLELKEPWRVKARIVHIYQVPAGTSIGYGREYVTKRPTTIGVLPIGYSDGFTAEPATRPKSRLDLIKVLVKNILSFFRVPGGSWAVNIGGTRVPIVGRVGMQLSMVDLGRKSGVMVGDLVELNLRRTTTSSRLTRVYIREGMPYMVRSIAGERSGENMTES